MSKNNHVPDGEISLDAELLKPLVGLRLHASAHNQYHLRVEFEVWLPSHVAAGRALEHEPKVWNGNTSAALHITNTSKNS